MTMRRVPCRWQGQSTMEYAMFIAVFAAALIAMNTYIQRSIQANLKTLEDQVNQEAVRTPGGGGGGGPPPQPPPELPPEPPPPAGL